MTGSARCRCWPGFAGLSVGAFAYSHGLEWAVEAGDIGDAATLSPWLDDLMTVGSIRSDAILIARGLASGARAATDRPG